MNRFIIVDGKPYLFSNNTAFAVRWDEKGFTVGGKVDIDLPPVRPLSEREVKAKCVVLDSIGDEMTVAEEETPAVEESTEQEVTEETTETEVTEETEPLDEMTVAELRAYAKENDIDLNGATLKADIFAAIKAAEQAVS